MVSDALAPTVTQNLITREFATHSRAVSWRSLSIRWDFTTSVYNTSLRTECQSLLIGIPVVCCSFCSSVWLLWLVGPLFLVKVLYDGYGRILTHHWRFNYSMNKARASADERCISWYMPCGQSFFMFKKVIINNQRELVVTDETFIVHLLPIIPVMPSHRILINNWGHSGYHLDRACCVVSYIFITNIVHYNVGLTCIMLFMSFDSHTCFATFELRGEISR